MSNALKVGIVGGAGYTAGEILRLLIHHPNVQVSWVNSSSQAGLLISQIHEGLWGDTELRFTDSLDFSAIDVLFICSAHGFSRTFLQEHAIPSSVRIIDLAQDFRDESDGFVYGLPELNRSRIVGATRVANPGCFATALQLGLLPLASAGLLQGEVHITALTGSTGAGVKPGATTHFSWRADNLSVYKAFSHQHLAEISRSLAQLQEGFSREQINFVPMRGNFARGIFASIYTDCPLSQEEATALYQNFYAGAAFTHVLPVSVDMKQVVNTNKALLSVEKHGSKLLILSTIDNLLKGASGQAVQNLNLMCGFDERAGLNLKPSGF
jgi:N-acetyl-gamma-glutamyl-phosphate reductase